MVCARDERQHSALIITTAPDAPRRASAGGAPRRALAARALLVRHVAAARPRLPNRRAGASRALRARLYRRLPDPLRAHRAMASVAVQARRAALTARPLRDRAPGRRDHVLRPDHLTLHAGSRLQRLPSVPINRYQTIKPQKIQKTKK